MQCSQGGLLIGVYLASGDSEQIGTNKEYYSLTQNEVDSVR